MHIGVDAEEGEPDEDDALQKNAEDDAADLADAADDFKKDAKSGSYNPFCLTYGEEDFEKGVPESVKTALYLELKPLAEAVEKLPFEKDKAIEDIIKNIVYLGLPDRIEDLGKPKQKRKRFPKARSFS